jgi:hypothetical protein
MWIGPGKHTIFGNCGFVQQTKTIPVQFFVGFEKANYILQKD